jgi:cytochrome P450
MTTQDTPIKLPFPAPPSLYHPAPELRALVKDQPVVRAELPDGSAAWLVTGYSEVRQVVTDQRFSRALAVSPDRPQRDGLDVLAADSILGMDPPEHTRVRKLVASAFTARRVQQLRPRVARIVGELLDGLVAGQRPADLVGSFSLPLPVQVICEMLGVPLQDLEKFHAWSDCLMGNWEQDTGAMMAALNGLSGYFAGLIELKRAEPADDLMTALIAARDEHDRLSEEELVRLCIGLLIGGHETTANQINMSLLTLLANPAELARLRAEPDLIPAAIEELMRFVQLGHGSPPARVTSEEVQLGGITIAAGEVVLPFFNIANRDPSAFPDPDRLNLGRTQSTHMGFGAGVHHCLGAQLARMELQEAYRGLLGRLPGLRLAVPAGELRLKDKMIIYSFHELPVTWDET